MARIIRGVEVDVVGHDYEYSPDINVVGYAYVTATDMDGKPFELTDEETEQLTTVPRIRRRSRRLGRL